MATATSIARLWLWALVLAALACSQTAPNAQSSARQATNAPSAGFEVLVQYREGAKDSDRAAARKSVNGRVKETLGAAGAEVVLVPKTKVHDSIDKVVAILRRQKSVRIAEPNQEYTIQPSRN